MARPVTRAGFDENYIAGTLIISGIWTYIPALRRLLLPRSFLLLQANKDNISTHSRYLS